jgi:catechol 2,3-dioxygenase-like lactoylglutathione lyase family enzyme
VSDSLKRLGVITLFVEDLERSRSFYRDVFGLKLVFEDENSAVFDFDNTLINLLRISEAPTLIEPRAVAGPEAGSRLLLTIWVEDADATCAELDAHGVALLNGPLDREWGVRTASFADPAGNVWEIAQQLAQAEA